MLNMFEYFIISYEFLLVIFMMSFRRSSLNKEARLLNFLFYDRVKYYSHAFIASLTLKLLIISPTFNYPRRKNIPLYSPLFLVLQYKLPSAGMNISITRPVYIS